MDPRAASAAIGAASTPSGHATNLPPLGEILARHDPGQLRQSPWWCEPRLVTVATILFFGVVRLIFGGGRYLCSAGWYALCLLIPFPFIFVGAGFGGMCVPLLTFDWPCAGHLLFVLAYCQIDLLVGIFS